MEIERGDKWKYGGSFKGNDYREERVFAIFNSRMGVKKSRVGVERKWEGKPIGGERKIRGKIEEGGWGRRDSNIITISEAEVAAYALLSHGCKREKKRGAGAPTSK